MHHINDEIIQLQKKVIQYWLKTIGKVSLDSRVFKKINIEHFSIQIIMIGTMFILDALWLNKYEIY